MPKEGIFIRVLRGDTIKVGDEIDVALLENLDIVENRLE
jgi:MOSC domain-containing protein YiiM